MIYLDNAATSFPKAPGVVEAVARCLAEVGGNPGRASHGLATAGSRIVFEAREACCALFGIPDAARLCFTKNATEALNLAILGRVPPGGRVVVSSLEHNSVMRPLRHLEAARGVRLRVVPFDACARPDPAVLRDALGTRPDLMVLTAASNVTGGLAPVGEIAAACRAAGVPLCLDASQWAGHLPLPVLDLDLPLVCCSGHKGLLGPGGTGALYVQEGFEPEPLLRGGTGSASEREEQPEFMPDRFEAGTANLPGLAGLLTAARWLAATGLEEVRRREAAVTDRLVRGLRALPGVAVPGPGPGAERAPVVSITVAGRDLGELALELDRRDVAVRVGLHCAPAAHRSLGTFAAGGTLRLSPGVFTTGAEVDAALATLEALLT
ncbi:MAG: aminotransferase class V-fold PLP-dependent enzyme [Holophaga sp.]|jgi:cysteine desulfurase family protein